MNNNRDIHNKEILMLICPAGEKLRELAHVAARQLEEQGFGRILDFPSSRAVERDSCRVLLVESGFEESILGQLQQRNISIDHHLILQDLGLEEDAEPERENIELIKDGMIAECVIPGSQSPKFNCPCGFTR